jgi:ADP-ribosyl-[dinitrogen reductase] hydrolase
MSDRLAGVSLGTAVGDALGLPAEGLSPLRRHRLLPGKGRHRFLLGRGMISDDTERALFVAGSLLKHPDILRLTERGVERSDAIGPLL